MKVAIHQPNFLPWLGYFYKIHSADKFVIIDNVQFVKGSICNRNKIKSNNGEAMWLTLPVQRKKGLLINFNELKISENLKWQTKMAKQIEAAYQKTEYFNQYYDALISILNDEYSSLADINIRFIKYFCKILQIETPIYITSEVNQNFGKNNQLTMGITKHFKGDIYLSGMGAKKYNDETLFKKNKIKLVYIEYIHPIYPQVNGPFISHLSIIDLIFNCGSQSRDILLHSKKD